MRLFTPGYASIDRGAWAARALATLTDVALEIGPHRYVFSVLQAQLPGGAPAYLIDCPALYARATLYTTDPDEHVRFLALTRAALIACERMGWTPQVVHCNDWHTAFAPLYLRTLWAGKAAFAGTRTLLTIHNIGYQGDLRAPPRRQTSGWTRRHCRCCTLPDLAAGRINALRHGILYADAVSTVSPTHAREICSDEYGMGLQDSLRVRAAQGALSGILNGVDYEEWDPRHDRYLPAALRPRQPRGEGAAQAPVPRTARPRGRARRAARRARQPPRGAEGHRADVRGLTAGAARAAARLRRARQRRAAVRGVLREPRAASSPGASPSIAATTTSSPTGSRRRPTCSSCPRATSPAA